jgi:hypothetical protein
MLPPLQQRNLDYSATPSSGRPLTDDIEAPPGAETPGANLKDLVDLAIYWENPVLSSILCLIGALIAFVGDYLLKGTHGVPLLSGSPILAELELSFTLFAHF